MKKKARKKATARKAPARKKATTKKAAPKRPRGRPAFRPTNDQRKLVRGLNAVGLTDAQIARFITDSKGEPIAERTLRNHFRRELDEGLLDANAKVGANLYNRATNAKDPQGVTAAIWWERTRGGKMEQHRRDQLELMRQRLGDPLDNPAHPGASTAEREQLEMQAALARELHTYIPPPEVLRTIDAELDREV